jgi:hypothetical protein
MAGSIQNIQRLFMNQMGQQGGDMPEMPLADTSEQIYISSLALLKMLKHGKHPIKNLIHSSSWSAHGSYGAYVRRIC